MRKSKKWNLWIAGFLGFVVLGSYIVLKNIFSNGVGSGTLGYWLGTFIGAGIAGAGMAVVVSYLRNRNIDKDPA